MCDILILMEKSKQTIICEKILQVASGKQSFLTVENAKRALGVRAKKNQQPYIAPLTVKLYAKKRTKDKMDYYKIEGKSDKVVLYIHGGAFINRPLIFHWKFIRDLNKATNATVYFPIYPLAPNSQFTETYSKILALYKHILKKTSPENIVVMGESAGGTITIGLCVLLKGKQLPQPAHIVPISACYDLTFSNPEIEPLNKVDLMLHSVGCRTACESWTGESQILNPLASPLFADLSGLPDMTIIVGTKEIMLPDTKLFVKKAQDAGINVNYIEKPEMGHAYPLYPTPEAKEAKDIIYKLL